MSNPHGPAGIGGWLILPVVGLLAYPLRVVALLATDFLPMFEGGEWSALTTPGSPIYHPLWAPAIVCEIAGNVGFLAFDLALLYLLFTKSPRFPAGFIVFALLNLLFVSGMVVLVWQITGSAGTTVVELARGAGVAAVWVPYMLVSKRVRNTFKAPETN